MSHALEAIGLLLAILDFTGWARKLEEIVDRGRHRYRDWVKKKQDATKKEIRQSYSVARRRAPPTIATIGLLTLLALLLSESANDRRAFFFLGVFVVGIILAVLIFMPLVAALAFASL